MDGSPRARISDSAAGSHSAAPSPGHSDEISAEIARLGDLDINELRLRWRRLFRRTAPKHLPRYLLLRIIAYRIQADLYGDLDRDVARLLDHIAKQRAAGSKPIIPPPAESRTLRPGTLLLREHGGVQHRVTVAESRFIWNGTDYRSLSEVARAITGTNWNGPRFFGLRDKSKEGRGREPRER